VPPLLTAGDTKSNPDHQYEIETLKFIMNLLNMKDQTRSDRALQNRNKANNF